MIKISKFPNNSGQFQRARWNCTKGMFGQGTVLATKRTTDKQNVMLLISDNGEKKEMFFENGKIMSISDAKNKKRTYIYENNNGEIKGKYFHSAPLYNEKAPLIASAMWISHKLTPEKLLIKINHKNPSSKIFIPSEYLQKKSEDFLGIGKRVTIENVLFKDFDNSISQSLQPATIVIKTTKGKTVVIKNPPIDYQKKLFAQLNLNSEELGNHIRTTV